MWGTTRGDHDGGGQAKVEGQSELCRKGLGGFVRGKLAGDLKKKFLRRVETKKEHVCFVSGRFDPCDKEYEAETGKLGGFCV